MEESFRDSEKDKKMSSPKLMQETDIGLGSKPEFWRDAYYTYTPSVLTSMIHKDGELQWEFTVEEAQAEMARIARENFTTFLQLLSDEINLANKYDISTALITHAQNFVNQFKSISDSKKHEVMNLFNSIISQQNRKHYYYEHLHNLDISIRDTVPEAPETTKIWELESAIFTQFINMLNKLDIIAKFTDSHNK
jgi:hypothetical protein